MKHPSDILRKIRDKMPRIIRRSLANTPAREIFYRIYEFSNERKIIKSSKIQSEDLPEFEVNFEYPSLQYRETEEKGIYEPQLSKELFEHLSHDDVFYDVGSNSGYFTQIACEAGVLEENIHAFEMNQRHAKIFERINPEGISLVQREIGSEKDQLSLDDYASEASYPDVIKIDVEGAEYSVLKGSSKILSDSNPVLYIEVHPQNLGKRGVEVEELGDFLLDKGYRLETVDHRNSDSRWENVEDTSDLKGYEPKLDDLDGSENTYLLKASKN